MQAVPPTYAVLLVGLLAGCASTTTSPVAEQFAHTLEPERAMVARFQIEATEATVSFDVRATGGRIGVYLLEGIDENDFLRNRDSAYLLPYGYPDTTHAQDRATLPKGTYAIGVRCESEATCAFRGTYTLSR